MSNLAQLPEPRMTTLDNGVRVVTQNVAAMQSASIGIRIDSSTRNEVADLAGASHFIEHLLFKGTERRTADQIMEEFDALGASVNAYTSHEEVFYYVTSLASALPASFEILADMYMNASFPPEEVEKERGVVLQEISMNYDNPGRYVYRQFHGGFWKAHPLGLCVLGTADSIKAVKRERLMEHKRANYLAGSTIVAAAGNVEHNEIVQLAERLLRDLPQGVITPVQAGSGWRASVGEHVHHHRPMEQTQYYMGYPAPPAGSGYRHTLALFNQILGSGMSSRLFREVRERRSLAYSVYSSPVSYTDAAGLLIFAGTSPERAQEAINVCHAQVMRFCNEAVNEATLASAQEQVRGKRLMALDDCGTQVRRISNGTSILGKPETIGDSLAGIAAVTIDDIRSFARSQFQNVTPRVESIGPGDGPGLPA